MSQTVIDMKAKAEELRDLIVDQLAEYGYTERHFNVFPGEHEDVQAPWIISAEEGPHEWVYSELLEDLATELDVYVEPVNHFVVGVYEA